MRALGVVLGRLGGGAWGLGLLPSRMGMALLPRCCHLVAPARDVVETSMMSRRHAHKYFGSAGHCGGHTCLQGLTQIARAAVKILRNSIQAMMALTLLASEPRVPALHASAPAPELLSLHGCMTVKTVGHSVPASTLKTQHGVHTHPLHPRLWPSTCASP